MTSFIPVRLAFTSIVPEDGVQVDEPIIFLHGLTQSSKNWNDIPTIVANFTKRKVYVLDARNHGNSEWSNDFSFDITRDDLLYFMDIHKICRAILVGHSLGGVTAYKTALKAPERVARIFSEDMSTRALPKAVMDNIILIAGLQEEALSNLPSGLDEAGAIEFLNEHIFNNIPDEFKILMKLHTLEDMKDTAPELVPTPDGRFRALSNLGVLKDSLIKYSYQMSDLPGTYNGPVCVVYGMKSPARIGSHLEDIRKIFPNVELIGIEGASHAVHVDRPKEFNEVLLKFLS